MGEFVTEFEFSLPKGYVDNEGNLHRQGVMRLATAADEVLPVKDPRVQQNPAYLPIILLSRVVTKLGSLKMVNTAVVENLFSGDFNFLQDMYNRINENGAQTIHTICPSCGHKYQAEVAGLGEQ